MNGEWINCILLPGFSVMGGLQVYSVLCEVCSNKLEQVHGRCIEADQTLNSWSQKAVSSLLSLSRSIMET